MVPTWWQKRFWQGQSRAHRGFHRARVQQRLMHKPLLEPLEHRSLLSLVAPVVYNTGQGPQGVAVGDLRGNGRLDIVTANTSGSVSVLLGNGNGTFQPAVNYATVGTSLALGQLQPGGPLDIVTAGGSTVSVLLGNGNGTFRPAVHYTADPRANAVAVAVATSPPAASPTS